MRRGDGELLLFWSFPAMAAIWIAAFFLFPGFLHPMSPSMPAEEVASFYREHTVRIRFSMVFFNWFCVCFIPVLMLLVVQIRKMAHRTPILAYCMIGCSAGGPTLFLMANLFWLLAAFRPERPAELTQLYNDVAWMSFSIQVPYLIMQSVLIALAVYWDRRPYPVFKPWVAHFNLLVAVALAPAAFSGVVTDGPLAWDGALTFWLKNVSIAIWIAVTGLVVGQAIRRQRAEQPDAVAEPVPA